MGTTFTIFLLALILAAFYEKAKYWHIAYFEEDWDVVEEDTPKRRYDDVLDDVISKRSIHSEWDTSMIQSVSWDAETREVVEIEWKDEF